MPIYEYVCMSCESHFEELVRHDETPPARTAGRRRRSGSSRSSRLTAPASSRSSGGPLRRRRAAAVAAGAVAAAAIDALSDHAELAALRDAVSGCTRCPLSATRTQVVFGSGSPTADLMFVGEAPGFHEDKQGIPFVGAAGQLLGKLLAGIGLTRDDVFVVERAQVPPSREPRPAARGDRTPARAISSARSS